MAVQIVADEFVENMLFAWLTDHRTQRIKHGANNNNNTNINDRQQKLKRQQQQQQ